MGVIVELRYYQKEAVDYGLLCVEKQYNPVLVLPTGAGKSLVLAGIIEAHISAHPRKRILLLSHVKEILEQDRDTVINWIGDIVGVYSAGMKERNVTQPVTIAGVQSIFKLDNKKFFNSVGLIIIDECHLVNHKDVGMYRDVIKRCGCSVLGLTATPYRLGHGYIYHGEDTVFDSLGYDGGNFENYNKLVEQGYLSRIISKGTELKLNLDGVRTTAGDYNLADLSDAVDQETITEAAIEETIKYGKKYKKWLVFGINIDHAEHIKRCLENNGISTGIVHSKMKHDRAEELDKFRNGEYRAMVNVDVLTTGFDVPDIDLIVMLRPTQSHTIHVQTVGRGARVSPNKDHCLFLDFAGNTERLGPINDIKIEQKKKKKKGDGEPIVKKCPECEVLHHPSVKICDCCGHVFEFKTKLQTQASIAPVVKEIEEGPKRWIEVDAVRYSIHQKPGVSDSLRVQYGSGLNNYSEWVAYGRPNWGGHLAKNWVRWRLPRGAEMPSDVHDLYNRRDELMVPKKIMVDLTGKYAKIDDCEF